MADSTNKAGRKASRQDYTNASYKPRNDAYAAVRHLANWTPAAQSDIVTACVRYALHQHGIVTSLKNEGNEAAIRDSADYLLAFVRKWS